MMYQTFRDRLIVDNFDSFKEIINSINEIKTDLKNQQRRVKRPIYSYQAYEMIKQIADPLVKIFRSRRYSDETVHDKFSYALQKLDLLVRGLQEFGREKLANKLSLLYQQLFSLLPKQTIIQHQLFDVERYQLDKPKRIFTTDFIQWLKDYKLFGYERRDIARRMAFKPIQVVQQSIKLRWL